MTYIELTLDLKKVRGTFPSSMLLLKSLHTTHQVLLKLINE